MIRILGCGTLVVGLLLMAPAQVQSQNKNANIVKATPKDYKALERQKEIDGIIASADSKSVTIRVAAGGAAQPGFRPGQVKIMQNFKEYELELSENVVVRKKFLDAEYDNKGNFKVNEDQKKELRAKGYITIKIEDVKSGNVAKLTLVAPKKDAKDEEAKSTVSKIVLTQEGSAASGAPKKKTDK